jgi:hypothetical protein
VSTPGQPRVETIDDPWRYTKLQLHNAQRIATVLNRGALVLCEAPRL